MPPHVPAVVAIYSGSADGAFTPCQAYAPLVIWEECYQKFKPKKDPKQVFGKARTCIPALPHAPSTSTPTEHQPRPLLLCGAYPAWQAAGGPPDCAQCCKSPSLHASFRQPRRSASALSGSSVHDLAGSMHARMVLRCCLPLCMQISDALGYWGQPWGDPSSSDVYSPVSTEPYPVQSSGYPQYGNGYVLQCPPCPHSNNWYQ